MPSFFRVILSMIEDMNNTLPRPESVFIPIPARPSTSELADDLLVDPEALKMETHEPGIYDEDGDYIPQYSDDPKDLEPTPLSAPEPPAGGEGDAEPAPPPAVDSDDGNNE